METAIMHGIQVAVILDKELCLMHVLQSKNHENPEMAEAKLRGIAGKITSLVPSIRLHYIVLENPLHKILTIMAEVYDALLLVAHKKSAVKLLDSLPHSGFPFLFVSSKTDLDSLYKQIVIPVGYMKKSKDLALWGSYFGRHNGASIDVFMASESAEADRKSVTSNFYSIVRLYRNFRFPYQQIESHSPTWKLQKAALNHSLGLKCGLLIISASFKTTFIDRMMGLTEDKMIEKSADLSVMCINSQRDLYTLCG
jgi:hypothetical protein